MSDETVLYTYAPVATRRLPRTLPERDVTARDVDGFTIEQLRDLKAFAARGEFYTPVNKSAATRAVNQARRETVDEATADAGKDGGN